MTAGGKKIERPVDRQDERWLVDSAMGADIVLDVDADVAALEADGGQASAEEVAHDPSTTLRAGTPRTTHDEDTAHDDFDRNPRPSAKLLSQDDKSRWQGGLFGIPLSQSREFKVPQQPTAFTSEQKKAIRRRALMAPLVAELEALLGPHTRTGVFGLTAAPAETFDEFVEYLKAHAAINDSMSFITPYRALLDREEFRPLLQALYERINPDARAPFGDSSDADLLLRRFTAELIRISPERFVSNHFSSAEGRDRIRRAMNDFWLYTDKDLSADFCKAIADTAEGVIEDYLAGGVTSQVSSFNYFNIGVSLEESQSARDAAMAILDGADRVFADREEAFEGLGEEAQSESSVFSYILGPHVGEEIQRCARFAGEKNEKVDPVSRLQHGLASVWLMAAVDEGWSLEGVISDEKRSSRARQIVVRHHIMIEAERLVREGDGIQTEAQLKQYNSWVQAFLHDPMNPRGGSAMSWLWHMTAGDGLDSYMVDIPVHIRAPFDSLAIYSDKLHHATEMGRRIYPSVPVVRIVDEEQKTAVTMLVAALQESVLDLWYSYKQHRAISRAGSNARMLATGEGDIADIRRAERILDGFIRRLENAKNTDEIKKIIAELYESLQDGGDIHTALLSAEMEGIEQLLGFMQTSAEFVILALATKGLGLPAAAGRTASLLRAFGGGAFVAFSENAVAVATGEARQGRQDTLINWLIDSAATGLAAVVTAFARIPKSNHPNILGRLYERYTSEGFRGFAGTFGADAGMEPLEELIDAYVNQALHGDFGALSWDEITEIFRICAVGGMTGVAQAKVGAIAEFTGRAVRKALPAVPPPTGEEAGPVGPAVLEDSAEGIETVPPAPIDEVAKPKSSPETRRAWLDRIVTAAEAGGRKDTVLARLKEDYGIKEGETPNLQTLARVVCDEIGQLTMPVLLDVYGPDEAGEADFAAPFKMAGPTPDPMQDGSLADPRQREYARALLRVVKEANGESLDLLEIGETRPQTLQQLYRLVTALEKSLEYFDEQIARQDAGGAVAVAPPTQPVKPAETATNWEEGLAIPADWEKGGILLIGLFPPGSHLWKLIRERLDGPPHRTMIPDFHNLIDWLAREVDRRIQLGGEEGRSALEAARDLWEVEDILFKLRRLSMSPSLASTEAGVEDIFDVMGRLHTAIGVRSETPSVQELIERDFESFRGYLPDIDEQLQERFLRWQEVDLDVDKKTGKLKLWWYVPYGEGLFVRTATTATEAEWHAWRRWQRLMNFNYLRREPAGIDPAQWLTERLQNTGLEFSVERGRDLNHHEAEYISALLSMVPETIFRRGMVRHIVLGESDTPTPYTRDSEFVSATRTAYIQPWTLGRPRRDMAAIILHEIGHGTKETIMNALGGEEAARAAWPMLGSSATDVSWLYTLNLLDGRKARRHKISTGLNEVIAETFLTIMVDREGLERHIKSLREDADPAMRAHGEAYQRLYDAFMTHIFNETPPDGETDATSPLLSRLPRPR